MKKLISMVLVLTLLSVVFAAAGMAATLRGTVRTPTSDGTVYVRTQAGEGKPVAGVARNGDSLVILKKGNTWHKVRVVRTGVEGWIYGRYVRFTTTSTDTSGEWGGNPGTSNDDWNNRRNYTRDASVTDTDSVVNVNAYVTSSDGYANLRWAPSLDSGVIDEIADGTMVWALERNGSFYRCCTRDGRIGYIHKNLLRLKDTADGVWNKTGVVRSSDGTAVVRDRASKSGYALYELKVGDRVRIGGSSGEWLRLSGDSAYMYRTLVRFLSRAETTGNVNVRSGPGTRYGILRTLSNGKAVTLLATDGNFCRVDTGTEIAYVSRKYLRY